ncbi:MAG: Rrf2 family transcriptional regulator [Proteobacteria bacterium]|nr:Rrf2 family transcriptional regulator [Pseudomonadota bacterium]NIS67848.1 Rrf2 family transcriptional regulator [Pseudomonadota bacterium]
MRLTRAGDYAVRCTVYIAAQGRGEVVSRREIAEAMEIPNQFLTKIAQQLARSGLIEIVQGARGGYRLLVSPEKLTLLKVVEAVTGEISLNDCVMRPGSCFRSSSCAVHLVWVGARDQMREALREVTFDKLVKEEFCTTLQCPAT